MAGLRELVERVREARERDGSDLSVQTYIGSGSYLVKDTAYGTACEALATWLLDHPEAVEAVEVLRAYGVALRRDDWGYEVDEVGERLAKLADRLAGGGDQ